MREAADIARSADDLVTMRAMRQVIERHGGGPWTAGDIAAITGRDVESVGRVLDEMVRQGGLSRHRLLTDTISETTVRFRTRT